MPITPPHVTDKFHQAVLAAMEHETNKIVQDEAHKAAQRVEERVRALAGQIATKMASTVHFDSGIGEIRITVRFPDRDTKSS